MCFGWFRGKMGLYDKRGGIGVKKIVAIFLALGILFSATGCQVNNDTATTEPTQAITTTPSVSTPPSVTTKPEETVPDTIPEITPQETLPQETTPQETTPAEPEPYIPQEWSEEERQRLWTPLCESFINFRAMDMTTVICQIPLGAELLFHKWVGQYALVTYNGRQGYVTANYIQPLDKEYFSKRLSVVSPTTVYSYKQMIADMAALQAAFPEKVQISSIGTSELGRDIPVMIVGNPAASKHILMQGAIHGREYLTGWLLMAIMDRSLSANLLDENVCYHIIPIVNPDGVIISQTQELNALQKQIYQQDLANSYVDIGQAEYAEQWKANALGIDLNRNFPSGWENCNDRTAPSSSRYQGESPLCAAESKALADYTQSRPFDATLSFHSHGSVLYYQYGDNGAVNQVSYQLAQAVQSQTGYVPVFEDNTPGAGYKDWAIDALGIPSITVEIGSSQTPLENRDIYNTFSRFEGLLPAISQWIASN